MSARQQFLELQTRIQRSIVGQESLIERLLIGMLSNADPSFDIN